MNNDSLFESINIPKKSERATLHINSFLCGRMMFSTLSKSLATFKHVERHMAESSNCTLLKYVCVCVRVCTNRSVQSVLCEPCSWLWRPLWCGPPPAGSVFGHVLRSLWPLWAQTPEPSRAPPSPAGASLAWAAHSAGQHYHAPATQRTERDSERVCVLRGFFDQRRDYSQ